MDLNAFIIEYWQVIVAACSLIIVGMIVAYFILKKENKGSIEEKIFNTRRNLREADEVLKDMQVYFHKVETKMNTILASNSDS